MTYEEMTGNDITKEARAAFVNLEEAMAKAQNDVCWALTMLGRQAFAFDGQGIEEAKLAFKTACINARAFMQERYTKFTDECEERALI